jgi:hypothetical protein
MTLSPYCSITSASKTPPTAELSKVLTQVLKALEGVEPVVQVPVAAYRALDMMKGAGLV